MQVTSQHRILPADRQWPCWLPDPNKFWAEQASTSHGVIHTGQGTFSLDGQGIDRGLAEWQLNYRGYGGEGGIRTHGTVSRTLAFEASTFNRSVTSPRPLLVF